MKTGEKVLIGEDEEVMREGVIWTKEKYYSERLQKVVIARSEATWQSHEIASLRSQ